MSQTRFPIYLLGIVSVLMAGSATAQAAGAVPGANTPRIDQRLANQEQRIDQGIASGALTTREAARMDRQQDHIDTMENRAKADGSVTRVERRHLAKAQHHGSRSIRRQKHDAQRVATRS
ncbi:hypothetical protein [Rivibacter subsaxonicus]|uniref:DUF4148 domain-containing protein n=1 Tax=Rivibacter subsaxonicus TaxID=457575 RepID=A0A4Q7VWH1_9BURK|nr:hypothetical protein [Rivibacter subsaxonicus]RZU00835.1 hypothetical protein EV670_1548 [Rivibacter subsaxonicus]